MAVYELSVVYPQQEAGLSALDVERTGIGHLVKAKILRDLVYWRITVLKRPLREEFLHAGHWIVSLLILPAVAYICAGAAVWWFWNIVTDSSKTRFGFEVIGYGGGLLGAVAAAGMTAPKPRRAVYLVVGSQLAIAFMKVVGGKVGMEVLLPEFMLVCIAIAPSAALAGYLGLPGTVLRLRGGITKLVALTSATWGRLTMPWIGVQRMNYFLRRVGLAVGVGSFAIGVLIAIEAFARPSVATQLQIEFPSNEITDATLERMAKMAAMKSPRDRYHESWGLIVTGLSLIAFCVPAIAPGSARRKELPASPPDEGHGPVLNPPTPTSYLPSIKLDGV